MNVRPIWATPNAEDLIIYMARVSNPKNQNNPKIAGLVRYLILHKHWSPFELANLCVEIKTSRAISAQILRHRSFSFQEFSQRYSPVQEIEAIEIRRKADKNRQSSADVFDPVVGADTWYNPETKSLESENIYASERIKEYVEDGQDLYKLLLNHDVAPETARMILPMASQTTLYMNGTLRSWIHYLELRTQDGVQKEHREIALATKDIFKSYFPIISEALGWSDERAE